MPSEPRRFVPADVTDTLSPAERYAAARTRAGHPQARGVPRRTQLRPRPVPARGLRLARRRATACWSPRPPAPARRSSPSSPCSWPMQQPSAKVFYTAPMKALSNQKFQELVAEYGADEVGLLTGDTNVNAHARIVVMTTEVLRNMLYADSDLLTNLAFVIMDEVHYLADRFRGAVWEEVIIHLPQSVRMVSLSATVSNAEEFGDWLQAVRGDTDVIVSEERPVPLEQHVLVKSKMLDLFDSSGMAATHRVNPELVQLTRGGGGGASSRSQQQPATATIAAAATTNGRSRELGRMDRSEIVRMLDGKHLLPAIFFIFSRVGCDQAVRQVLRAGVRLTDAARARRDPRDRRGTLPHPARRGPGRARLLGVARRARARRRRAPRRPAARVQGGRRGALPEEARQGRLRHRDSRARHQHAGAHRRAREAREVQRRGPGADHAGGVHPAHRPRRPPRHRRRGPLRHPVAAGARPAGGRLARLPAHLPAQLELQADLQHGRQPDRPVRPRRAPARSSSRRSPSSRPTAPSSTSPARCASRRSRSPATPRR